MKRLRFVCGLAAIVLVLVGLNLLVLTQQPFSMSVMAPLGIGFVSGAVWGLMTLWSLIRYSAAEGKAAYTAVSVVNSLLFLGICIVAYAFVQHNGRTWDLTQEGRRKLADQTIQVLQVLNKDVEVTGFFLQVDDELVRIAQDKTERFLEQCQEYTSHLRVEFLDPQIERTQLESMHITHASTQGTVVIKCGTRQRVITLQGGSPRLEEKDFTNALINVMRDTQPRICFLSGHGERNIEDQDEKNGGSALKVLLEGESYRPERIGIQISHPEVPADCDVLVVNGLGLSGGPQADLHPEELKAIQAYLDRGGRMLFLLDPWRRTTADSGVSDQLIPWLAQRYGILVGDDVTVSPTSKFVMEFTGDKSRFRDADPYPGYVGCFNSEHPITQSFDQKMLFSIARTVGLSTEKHDKVVGSTLLRSTPDFFAETDLATLMATGKANRSPDEKEGPLPVAVAVSAKTNVQIGDSGQTRDARIVVVGDSDFASNGQLSAVPGNLNFMLNTIAWLTENEDLIAIRPTGKQDPAIILSDADQRAIVWIAVLGTVQVVAAVGLLAFWMRRKYQ